MQTLLVNYQKSNLNIFPVIIPSIEDYKEKISKLSSYLSFRVLSEDFGDRISVIKEENYGFFKKCHFFKNRKKIIFENNKATLSKASVLEIIINKDKPGCYELEYEIDFLINKFMFFIKRGLLDLKELPLYLSEDLSSYSKYAANKVMQEIIKNNSRLFKTNFVDITTLYIHFKNILSTCHIFMNAGVIVGKQK